MWIKFIFIIIGFFYSALKDNEFEGFEFIPLVDRLSAYTRANLNYLKAEFDLESYSDFEHDYISIKSPERSFLSKIDQQKIGASLNSCYYRNEAVLVQNIGFRFIDLIKLLLADPTYFRRDLSKISVMMINGYVFPDFLLGVLRNEAARIELAENEIKINNLNPYRKGYYKNESYEYRVNLHIHKSNFEKVMLVGISLEDEGYCAGRPRPDRFNYAPIGDRNSIEFRPYLQNDLYLVLPAKLFTEFKDHIYIGMRNLLPSVRDELGSLIVHSGSTQDKLSSVIANLGSSERGALVWEVLVQLRLRKNNDFRGVIGKIYPKRQDILYRIAEELLKKSSETQREEFIGLFL